MVRLVVSKTTILLVSFLICWVDCTDDLIKNYASNECGAKVIATNPEAEGANKILDDAKDDYMLNPCKAEMWFVVELCEPVQVTSLELANFELYSSTPKEMTFLGSDKYPTTEWIDMGVFEAADSRDLQSFDIPSAVPPPGSPPANQYIKFVRVDINTFYGSEHFCPVSLIRAFGQPLAKEFDALESKQNVESKQNKMQDLNGQTPGASIITDNSTEIPDQHLEETVAVPSSTDPTGATLANEVTLFHFKDISANYSPEIHSFSWKLEYSCRWWILPLTWIVYLNVFSSRRRKVFRKGFSKPPNSLSGTEIIIESNTNIFQHSLEQLVISTLLQVSLITWIDGEITQVIIPLINIIFLVGRIFIWLGYPTLRSLGMVMTLVPSLLMCGYTSCKFFSHLSLGK